MNNPVSGESSAKGLSVILPYIAVDPAAVAIRRPELLQNPKQNHCYMKTKLVIKGTAIDSIPECLVRHEAYAKWIFPLQNATDLAERCDTSEVLLDYTYSQIMKHVLEAEEIIKKLQHFIKMMKHSHEDYIEHRAMQIATSESENKE